jgi:hypothetical protein
MVVENLNGGKMDVQNRYCYDCRTHCDHDRSEYNNRSDVFYVYMCCRCGKKVYTDERTAPKLKMVK